MKSTAEGFACTLSKIGTRWTAEATRRVLSIIGCVERKSDMFVRGLILRFPCLRCAEGRSGLYRKVERRRIAAEVRCVRRRTFAGRAEVNHGRRLAALRQLADVSYTIVPGPKKTTTRAMTVLIPKSSADGRTWKHWTPGRRRYDERIRSR